MPIHPPATAERPSALLPSRAALAALLDGTDEPLLLFDDLGQLSFCNRAAMRQLRAEPGQGASQLQAVLGTAAAVVLTRFGRFRGRRAFNGLLLAPLVMPDIIIGLSFGGIIAVEINKYIFLHYIS